MLDQGTKKVTETGRIRVTRTPPIDPVHGVTRGREFDVHAVTREKGGKGRLEKVWIWGDANAEAALLPSEFEWIEEPGS